MFRQLLTITANTYTESIRQPIFLVLTLVAAIGLTLNPSLSAYSMETGDGDRKLLVDMGLSMVFLTGILLAAFTATGVLSREIEQRTVLTVVSKPVARPVFVIGKYLGVAGAILTAYWVLSLLLMSTYRHGVMSTARDQLDWPVIGFNVAALVVAGLFAAAGNYLYRWVFASTFIRTWALTITLAFAGVLLLDPGGQLQNPLHEFIAHRGELVQIAVGLLMIFEAVLILTALAIAVSTRLGQVMTLLICVGVFLLGIITSSLSGKVNLALSLPADLDVISSVIAVVQANLPWATKLVYGLTKLLYVTVPNLQFLWPADAISQGHSLIHDRAGDFSLRMLGLISAYAGLYTTVVLAAAVVLFQRREVG